MLEDSEVSSYSMVKEKATYHWGNTCSSCYLSGWNNTWETIWWQTEMHFCLKAHGKHCWRFVETSIRTNYAVWEICCTAGWKHRCLLYLCLWYLLDSVSVMTYMKNYLFLSYLKMNYVFFFYKNTSIPNSADLLTSGCQ